MLRFENVARLEVWQHPQTHVEHVDEIDKAGQHNRFEDLLFRKTVPAKIVDVRRRELSRVLRKFERKVEQRHFISRQPGIAMIEGNLIGSVIRYSHAAQQTAMVRHAVRIEICCRNDQKDVFLVEPRQDIARQQDHLKRARLRFDQIGPKCLGAKEAGDKAHLFLKDRKRRKVFRLEVDHAQIGSGAAGMSVFEIVEAETAGRPRGRDRSRFEVGLDAQPGRERAGKLFVRRGQLGLENLFVGQTFLT